MIKAGMRIVWIFTRVLAFCHQFCDIEKKKRKKEQEKMKETLENTDFQMEKKFQWQKQFCS